MGQTKTKFDCPLCGSQADQDDGCDSPPPIKPDAPFAVSFFVPDDVPTRCTSGSDNSGGAYASYTALQLTSVAEETSTSGDNTADGEANAAAVGQGGLPPQSSTTSSSGTSMSAAAGRQNMVVMRGNIRHHGSGGHRVR